MTYQPGTDFVGLWRSQTGGVAKAEMPGLDFVVAALGRAGILSVIFSSTPPTTNQPSTAWFKTATQSYSAEGTLYLWDATSSSYLPATPALFNAFLTVTASYLRYDTPQTLTGPQQTQARQNVYAAPFDAMEYNGMQVNGSMGVNQEFNLGDPVPLLNVAPKYIVDGFYGYKSTTATITGKQVIGGVIGNGFYRAALQLLATSAMTSGAGDYVYVGQKIEGFRVAKLGWGSAVAQPITIAFWIMATVAGHISLVMTNNANDRSYATDVPLVGGNVWEYKTITIPGDVTGTWDRNNTTGIGLFWTLACGATYQTASLNAWTAGNFIATTAQTNLLSTINNQVSITGVTILPGIEAPSAARSSFIVRPADNELITCARYLQSLAVANGYFPVSGLTNGLIAMIPMLANMRVAPTVYLPWGDSNYNSAVSPTTWAFAIPGVANMTKTGTLTTTGYATQPGVATAIFYGATISGNSVAINSGSSIVPIKLDARL